MCSIHLYGPGQAGVNITDSLLSYAIMFTTHERPDAKWRIA